MFQAANTNDSSSSLKPKTNPLSYIHLAQYPIYNGYRQIYSLIQPRKRGQTVGKEKLIKRSSQMFHHLKLFGKTTFPQKYFT